MKGAIAVFVKTPDFSPVKTRLAAHIGKKNAEQFYKGSVKSVVSVIQELPHYANVQNYFAVAEQIALDHNSWNQFPSIWQGEGELGERMFHIYHSLLVHYDYVVILGSDIPQLNIADVKPVIEWFSVKTERRLGFAPSSDGGFWLMGGNCEIPKSVWVGIEYSRANTGDKFLEAIQPFGKVNIFNTLCDVDEWQDLKDVFNQLRSQAKLTNAQKQLFHFLAELVIADSEET